MRLTSLSTAGGNIYSENCGRDARLWYHGNWGMYRLVFQNRAGPKEPLVIDLPSLVIGRSADCQIQLVEPGVSNHHAAIERRADGYFVHRLDSSGATYVNHDVITERRLSSGDELEIGSARIRFEIIHGGAPGRQRPPVDLLQALATAIVVAVIVGEVTLLGSIFSENRPNKVKLDVTHNTTSNPKETEATGLSTPATALSDGSRQSGGTAATAPPPTEPMVLNRMIRIARMDRNENGDAVSAVIQVKAQVGERELNTAAVAICVQFAAVDGGGFGVDWREPIWLKIPAWDNFTSRAFTVRYPGVAHELVGFVVRTYYHRQMQDIGAVPPSLRSLAPNPPPGGAP
jgi:pSer/pThr/pTyr-binding forkhead associated (FHA) protein